MNQPVVQQEQVSQEVSARMNQGFPDIDTNDIKFSLIPSHAVSMSETKTKKKRNSGNASGFKPEISLVDTEKEERRFSFWIKKLFSHRILWFLILMPVYVVFIVVTIIFSTSVAKRSDPESYSPADTFFGITYILFMSVTLAFVLRYFCHKCDHESRQCTCPPEQLIHEVVRRNYQNGPKRKFLERPQPFIPKKQTTFASPPVPELV